MREALIHPDVRFVLNMNDENCSPRQRPTRCLCAPNNCSGADAKRA